MKSLHIISITFLLSSVIACRKEKYYLFNDEARLQFGADPKSLTGNALTDSSKNFTFVYNEPSSTQDTAWFDIYAIGGIDGQSRPYRIRQVNTEGVENAVAGKHYKAFDEASLLAAYTIPANQVHARIPIVLLRDPSLKTSSVVLKFEIVENDHFKLGERSLIWRKLIITDRLVRPAAWNLSAELYYYGKYSRVKHQFMVETTGKKWDQEMMAALSLDGPLQRYYIGILTEALADYNNEHPSDPLRDENGELVVFP